MLYSLVYGFLVKNGLNQTAAIFSKEVKINDKKLAAGNPKEDLLLVYDCYLKNRGRWVEK